MSTGRNFSRRQFLAGALASCAKVFAEPSRLQVSQSLQLRLAPCSLEIAPNRFVQTTSYLSYDSDAVIHAEANRVMDVHIHNETGMEDFVHWHGLRLPASLDGTPEEDSLGIAAGASLRYCLPPQEPGFYFLHSHAMAGHDLSCGPYSGQFLPLIIGSLQSPVSYDREIVLTSHEWEPHLVDTAGNERSMEAMHHLRIDAESEEDEAPDDGWDIAYRAATLHGRMLGAGEPIRVRAKERILFRILNASATEQLRLSLPGHRFLVLSLDGYPVPNPVSVEVLELGVGERIDALVRMDSPGVWVLGSPEDSHRTLGMGVVVEYSQRDGPPVWSPPMDTSPWEYTRFAGASSSTALKPETLTYRIERHPTGPDGFERWAMVCSSKSNKFHAGERYRMTLLNTSDEQHPMHLHRFPFELVSIGGEPCHGIRKDTVVVPPYQSVVFDFKPNTGGPALLHCHNQMHMDCGLKTILNIS